MLFRSLLALALAGWVGPALPWLMSAAAGCMVAVTAQEMIPQAVEGDEPAGVLSVVLGVVLVINPFGAMETLVMAIGIILIVEGAINLLSALYTVLAVRRFTKLHPETQSMLESLTGEDLNGDGVVAPDVTRTDAEASAVELDEVDESATVEQENEK